MKTEGTPTSPKAAMFIPISPILVPFSQTFSNVGVNEWERTPFSAPAIACNPHWSIASKDLSKPTGPASPACMTSLHSAWRNSTSMPPGKAPWPGQA